MLGFNKEDWDINYDEPLFKVQYGEGCYQAKYKKSDPQLKECSIKIIKNLYAKQITENEISKILVLKNNGTTTYPASLIKYYGYGIDESTDSNKELYIYMEKLDGYKTTSDLVQEGYKFTELEVGLIVRQLLDALVYLHSNDIAHLNIKLNNILYNKSNNDVKLINLELSRDSNQMGTYGTAYYRPTDEVLSKKTDTWCLGRTLIDMVNGLYQSKDLFRIASTYSTLLKRFIRLCLTIKADERPDPYHLKDNMFLRDVHLDRLKISSDESKQFKSLSFDNFDAEVAKTIDSTVKQVIISSDFGINAFSLTSLTSIILESFNQPIPDNSLPSSIESIRMFKFNQPISINTLPKSLVKLQLSSFNHIIKDQYLPDTIEILLLPSFNHQLEKGQLPSSTKILDLSAYTHELEDNQCSVIPDAVIDLKLSSNDKKFNFENHKIQVLELGTANLNMEGVTPSSLIHLSSKFDQQLKSRNLINSKDSSILELSLTCYNRDIPRKINEIFPANLVSLTLGSKFTPFIKSLNQLPNSIRDLTFGVERDKVNQDTKDTIINSIPSDIKNVKVYYQDNNTIFYQSIESSSNLNASSQIDQIFKGISLGVVNDSLEIDGFINENITMNSFKNDAFSLSNNKVVKWNIENAIVTKPNQVRQFKKSTNGIDYLAHENNIYSGSDISSLKSIKSNNNSFSAYVHYLIPRFEIMIPLQYIQLDDNFINSIRTASQSGDKKTFNDYIKDRTHFPTRFVIGAKISQSYTTDEIIKKEKQEQITETLSKQFIKSFKDQFGKNIMKYEPSKAKDSNSFKFDPKVLVGGDSKCLNNLEKLILSLNNIKNCKLVEISGIYSIWDILKVQDSTLYGQCRSILGNKTKIKLEVFSFNQSTDKSIFKIDDIDNSSQCGPGLNVAVINPNDLKLRFAIFDRKPKESFKLVNYLEDIEKDSIIMISTNGACSIPKDALDKLNIQIPKLSNTFVFSAIVKKGHTPRFSNNFNGNDQSIQADFNI